MAKGDKLYHQALKLASQKEYNHLEVIVLLTKAIDNFFGKPTIIYHPTKAFSSVEVLYRTMGHELVHVSQYAQLAAIGAPGGLFQNKDFVKLLEYHAGNFELHLQGLYLNEAAYNWGGVYHNHQLLDWRAFSWTKNARFIWPF